MASGCPVPLELQSISRPNAKPILIVSIWYYEVKNWRWIFVSKWVPVMNSCPCATLSRPRCLHGFESIFNTKFLAFKTYYCHILCFHPCYYVAQDTACGCPIAHSTRALANIVYFLSTKNNNVMIEGHLGSLFVFNLQYVYLSYWFPIHGVHFMVCLFLPQTIKMKFKIEKESL